MSMPSGTVTPHTNVATQHREQHNQSPASVMSFRTASEKNDQVQDVLKQLQGSLSQLGGLVTSVKDHSSRLADTGPRVSDALSEVNEMKHKIHAMEKNSDDQIAQAKRVITDKLPETVYKQLSPSISDFIRAEIERQTKSQVQVQIAQYLPVSLETQAAEIKKEKTHARLALLNAEARRANAQLMPHVVDDTLASYITPNGKKGTSYPSNLRALVSYDQDRLDNLMTEYGLPVYERREDNINRFLHHIGCRFEIFQIPLPNSPIGDAVGIRLS